MENLETDGLVVFSYLNGRAETGGQREVGSRDVSSSSSRSSVPVVPSAAGRPLSKGMASTGVGLVVPGNETGRCRPRPRGIWGGISGGILVSPGKPDTYLCDDGPPLRKP